MNKVFISRSDGNIPWGFRLQGGLEDNEPLTLTNVSVYVRVPISKTTDQSTSIFILLDSTEFACGWQD